MPGVDKVGADLLARKVTRRDFVKTGSLLALGATSFPTILAACSTGGSPSKSAPKTLKIQQWSHLAPGSDKWCDPWGSAWAHMKKRERAASCNYLLDMTAR